MTPPPKDWECPRKNSRHKFRLKRGFFHSQRILYILSPNPKPFAGALEYPPKDLECLHKNSDTVNPRQNTDFFIYKGFCTQKIQRQTFSIQIPLFFKYTVDPPKGLKCQKNALINSAQNERPKFLWERFKECHLQIKVNS